MLPAMNGFEVAESFAPPWSFSAVVATQQGCLTLYYAAGSAGNECVHCHMPKIERIIADVNVRKRCSAAFFVPGASALWLAFTTVLDARIVKALCLDSSICGEFRSPTLLDDSGEKRKQLVGMVVECEEGPMLPDVVSNLVHETCVAKLGA